MHERDNNSSFTISHYWRFCEKLKINANSCKLIVLKREDWSCLTVIYLFKANDGNTKTMCKICSKLIVNTPEGVITYSKICHSSNVSKVEESLITEWEISRTHIVAKNVAKKEKKEAKNKANYLNFNDS